MKTAHVLYVTNIDETQALLVLSPDTDSEVAIAAIEEKIREVELCDIDENEYYEETYTAPGFFRESAESIWNNHDGIYIENRWEATYDLALNVPIL
jgi:hypothetical protein